MLRSCRKLGETTMDSRRRRSFAELTVGNHMYSVSVILANDYSKDAVEAMRQNVVYNGVEAVERPEKVPAAAGPAEDVSEPSTSTKPVKEGAFLARGLKRRFAKSGVLVNEGDAL
jgi:hypothetical protein